MLLKLAISPLYHGKYREWNGSTLEISCWADLAWPSAGIKNSPKNLSFLLLSLDFKYELLVVNGINQFSLKIRAF